LAVQRRLEDARPVAAGLEEWAMNHSPRTTVPKVQGQKAPPPPKVVQKPKPDPKSAPSQRPILVAIDPGHGGEDPGAIGPSGTREKDVVLQIARRLQQLVDAQPNMRAYSTRDGD